MLQSTWKKQMSHPSENDLQKVPVHKRNMKEISSEKFKKKLNDKIPRTVNLQHISWQESICNICKHFTKGIND